MCLAIGLEACGQAGDGPAGSVPPARGLRIGLLLPENQPPRYEQFDKPLIEAKVRELCPDCTVDYANARGDAIAQHQQVDAMISNRVDVLVLDAVDTGSLRSSVEEAHSAHIPVVAYDNLSEGPVSAFVSFDGEQTSRILGETLRKALSGDARGGRIVRVEGPRVSDQQPALSELKGIGKVTKPYVAAAWNAGDAYAVMSGAIARLGDGHIQGVLAVTDALSDGVISALKDARIHPLPPVTGQDADLAAVRRIVSGDQYMTVYKSYRLEADAAATMAVALGRGAKATAIGKNRISSRTTKDIPSVLLTAVPVTVANVKSTVVKDGAYTIRQICTPELKSACNKAGLT